MKGRLFSFAYSTAKQFLVNRSSWRGPSAGQFVRYLSHRNNDSARPQILHENLLRGNGAEGGAATWGLIEDLKATGLVPDDPRLHILQHVAKSAGGTVTTEAVSENTISLIERALSGRLVVPDFQSFAGKINELHKECSLVRGGQNADYIPELAHMDPNLWGVSLCTVDGQRHSVGDSDVSFTLQSAGKCISYSIAVDEYGSDLIHQYIGKEPSGASFNSLFLNSEGKPHNPMINMGAIVLSSLIKPSSSLTERVNFMLQKFCAMAGLPPRSIKCDLITCDSEMETAHRNYALMHYMMDMKVFPPGSVLEETLKFYTRLCSVEVNCNQGAVLAATLANGGSCPITGEEVLGKEAVRNALTLMHSCGMYDSAGEFSFAVGLPAKSGVSGCILVVVPNVMGFCLFSPPVNRSGNSVKGLHFCQRLVETFNFHLYDSPTLASYKKQAEENIRNTEVAVTSLLQTVHAGDLQSLESYVTSGVDLSQYGYDRRTPLHVAAAEGHWDVVDFLLSRVQVPVNPLDKWLRTPLDDALFFRHMRVADFLRQGGALSGSELQQLQSS